MQLERKQGLLGSFLGQRADAADDRDPSAPDVAAGDTPEKTEAYEEDWYRSLKALAERQQALAAEEEEAEPGPSEGTLNAEATAQVQVSEDSAPAGAVAAGTEPITGVPAEPIPAEARGAAPTDAVVVAESGAPVAVAEPAAPVDAISPPETRPFVAAPPEPVAPPSPPAMAEAVAPPPGPSLTSPDPEERRAALASMRTEELSDESVTSISALVFDPDAEIRRLALEALASRADRIEDATVRQALQDPSDEVRAAAVRLAAGRGARDLMDLLALIGARGWPLTQRTVLEVLPRMIAVAPPFADVEVAAALFAVGDLDSAPLEAERLGLEELARAVGVQHLLEALAASDRRRLGAVRLLAGQGSPEVLRALAAAHADPVDEIKEAAAAAAETLERMEPPAPAEPAFAAAPAEEERATTRADQVERVDSLARALTDPDESVRHLALSGLAGIDRGAVLRWAADSLARGDEPTTKLAAGAVLSLGLPEAAAAVLDRAATTAGEVHEALVGALASLGFEPGRLVGLLDGVDETRRAEAVRVVYRIGGPSVLLPLRTKLDDPSIPTRVAVLEILSEAGDAVAAAAREAQVQSPAAQVESQVEVPATPATAAEPQPSESFAVVDDMTQIAGPTPSDGWAAALARALSDPDPNVRTSAVEALQGLEGEVGHLLVRALADPDQRVRVAAARRLAPQPGDRGVVWDTLRDNPQRRELVGAMEHTSPGVLTELALERLASPDRNERVMAVEVVGWGTTQACVEAAIHALQDPVAQVRRAATESLARLRDPSAAGALGQGLADPDRDVRVGVVRALGVIDDESVLGFLVSALSDPDPGVRHVASEVLTQWSSPAVAKRLAGVLAVPGLRDAVSDVLTRIGPSSVELLIDVLLQGNPAIVHSVGELLKRIVGADELIGRMSAVDPERRLRGAEAVGAIGGPASAEALMRSLSDPDERIRTRCAQLLARIGDPRAAAAIQATVLHDPVPEVVAAAQQALTQLGGNAA